MNRIVRAPWIVVILAACLVACGAAAPTQPTGPLAPPPANGSMTNTTNASYRGTVALGGDMYVRTQTHGGVAGRYGIGAVLKR